MKSSYCVSDKGIAYHVDTSKVVRDILDDAYYGERIRIYYGDAVTGLCWMDEFDTIGTIGRSTGTYKIPLLIKNSRSTGGGAILDHCIIRIDSKYCTLYKHPLFHFKELEKRYNGIWEVTMGGELSARFNTEIQADRYIAFMEGKRWSK